MPPPIYEDTSSKIVSIKKLKQCIPPDCFEKKPIIGLYYIFRDFFIICSAFCLFSLTDQNLLWKILYWNISGFFMWCLFVDGHDCGHGSFSDNYLLNTIVGHLCHTPLLVPYSTWANSHRHHHLHHNHVTNDYSYRWIDTCHKSNKPFILKIIQYCGLLPSTGWLLYMLGLVDGGHWIPFGGELWKNNTLSHFIKSCISSILVFAAFFYYIYLSHFQFETFMVYYGYSWFIFSSWLITTTYLQHHDNTVKDTIVYGDESWTFVKGALQTVDRSYGSIIDHLSHHITNGHLVHHFFFNKIPHYKLEKATQYLYKYLDENQIEYKYRYTPDFFIKIFKLTFCHLNEATVQK